MRIQDDTLTVDLRDALIGKVLEQISRQGNIRIVSEAPIERHITILFNGLQIDQGLKKILRGQDIIFLYSKREEGATSLTVIVIVAVVEPPEFVAVIV